MLAALIAAGALLGYEILLALASSSPRIAAFLNVGNETSKFQGHYDYRGALLERGLQEASKHMWLGTGMGNVTANLMDMVQGQGIIDFVNTYLWIYLVSGLIGLVSTVGLMVWVIIKLAAVRTRGDAERRSARAFILVSFIVMIVELSFMSVIGCIPFFIVLILACSRVVRLERGRSAAVARSGAPTEAAPPGTPARPRRWPAPAPA